MIFTTLNTIIEDIMKIIRGSIIASTEPISKRQVEDWVHQYRAELIRQDINKGYYADPGYIQTIESLDLSPTATTGLYVTDAVIPKTINLRYKSGITWVGDANGERLEFTGIPQSRDIWQQHKRYTPEEITYFKEDGRLYIRQPLDEVSAITVKGIFENPMEVIRLADPIADRNVPYPIPTNKVSTLKEMVIKGELKIEAVAPSDTTNDSEHNPKPNQ